jgi:DMSO reductase anchor subunit
MTRYVTARILPDNLVAGDAGALRPQPPHWPLVVMLTLMPVAVGLACAAAIVFPTHSDQVTDRIALWSWVAGVAGLAVSGFHLGRPLRAWRIFLGWRTSWLSREALAFGVWLALASAALVMPAFVIPSALMGLVGLACSAMIYIDTRRHFWRAAQAAPRFFGTAVIVGLAPFAPQLAAALLATKLAWESRTFFDQSISARLQKGPLAKAVLVRDSLGLLGVVLLAVAPGWSAIPLLLAGELAERHLFFRAVDAPKMPGVAA